MKNTHGEDILHLRERSAFILYAAGRLFSDCKLVNPHSAPEKIEGGRLGWKSRILHALGRSCSRGQDGRRGKLVKSKGLSPAPIRITPRLLEGPQTSQAAVVWPPFIYP